MRIDTTTGLFRPATTGLSVPSHSAANVKAQPARDPTLAPDPVGLSRAARTYTKTSPTAAPPTARLGAGPALSVTLSPEARAWMAQRGLAEEPPAVNEKEVDAPTPQSPTTIHTLNRAYPKATEVPVPLHASVGLDLGA